MSDIYGFVQDVLVTLDPPVYEEHAYCPDCAVKVLFNGDQAAYDAVDNGDDNSLLDADGCSYQIIHEASILFEPYPADFYPAGLFCFVCGGEILSPGEEDEESEDV